MRKITFILLALISGTAFAQNKTEADAQVFAEIVNPIIIEKTSDLSFGKIAVGDASGTVTVPADASFTATYSVPEMKIPTSTVAPARFIINAPIGTSYSIAIPSATLTSGTESMDVTFSHNRLEGGNVGKGVDTQLLVGGVLTVAADQAAGDYTGTVSVTVTYE